MSFKVTVGRGGLCSSDVRDEAKMEREHIREWDEF